MKTPSAQLLLGLLLASSAAFAADDKASPKVIPLSCQTMTLNQHQEDPYSAIDFKVDACGKWDEITKGSSPSSKMEKFKVVSDEQKQVLYVNNVKTESSYYEQEVVIYRSTQFIPECQNFSNSWRLQIGAITGSKVVANELFFHLLQDIVSLQEASRQEEELVGRDLSNWQICKTSGEEYGQEKSEGSNITTRLYLQKMGDPAIPNSPASPRENLVASCREQMENSSLFAKLKNLMPKVQQIIAEREARAMAATAKGMIAESTDIESDAARVWVIPPMDALHASFTVNRDKYQFTDCSSLESSPSLRAKKK